MGRYHTESWGEALDRVPALSQFVGVELDGDGLSRACDLVDTLPGFELLQVLPRHAKPCFFLYRRVTP